jgi:hypothetical protein
MRVRPPSDRAKRVSAVAICGNDDKPDDEESARSPQALGPTARLSVCGRAEDLRESLDRVRIEGLLLKPSTDATPTTTVTSNQAK